MKWTRAAIGLRENEAQMFAPGQEVDMRVSRLPTHGSGKSSSSVLKRLPTHELVSSSVLKRLRAEVSAAWKEVL